MARLFWRSQRTHKHPMTLSWEQTFTATWTLRGKSDTAHYDVHVEIEGPERRLMTDVAPIIEAITTLQGKDLSTYIGKSSLEAVTLYVRGLVHQHLERKDHVKRIRVLENNLLAAEVS